jgi:hypothetical protein
VPGEENDIRSTLSLHTAWANSDLFNDFLMASLNRTIAAKERNGIAILVCENLDFQVSGRSSQLHDEDRGTCE